MVLKLSFSWFWKFWSIVKIKPSKTTDSFDKSAENAPRVKARKKHAASAPLSWLLSVALDTKNVVFCVEIGVTELETNIVVILKLFRQLVVYLSGFKNLNDVKALRLSLFINLRYFPSTRSKYKFQYQDSQNRLIKCIIRTSLIFYRAELLWNTKKEYWITMINL